MNLGWGAPALLGGLALVGVPVLIHLLNRRRYEVKPFAAMAFLQQAFAKRRRRLRLENLLLLVLRCLAVCLAALAMAQPFVPPDSLLSLVSAGRRDVVLVVDRSGSMGRMVGPDTTLDDRVLERVRAQVGRLSTDRGDTVTLITPGGGELLPGPLGASPAAVMDVLDAGLPPPSGTADLVAAARLIKDRVRPLHRGRLEIEIHSDLQERSWGERLGPLLAEVLEDGGGSLRIVDVVGGGPTPANLGVESLEAQDALLVEGEVVSFVATVRNHGDVAVRGLTGTFALDKKTKQRRTDLEVPPRGTADVELRLRLDGPPGPRHLSVTLEGDELPFDDARTLAFEVRDGIDVLLVDGQHGASRLDGATSFLELALDPRQLGDDAGAAADDGSGLSSFRTRVVDVRTFEEAGAELYRPDAIVLANVGVLSAETATLLDEVVSSGTPLLVFTGDRLDPRTTNERLGALLPAVLGEARGDSEGTGEQDYVTLVLGDPPAPELSLFADPRLAVLLQVPVLAWNVLEPTEDAEVLAWFADALGETTPAIVSRPHGRGRVLLVGTSADDDWSLLPRQPATWLPLVHELMRALTARDPGVVNLPVGQSPTLVVDGQPASARLVSPAGAMEDIGRPEARLLGRRSELSLEATPLREAGAWALEIEPADATMPPRTIALSAWPDAAEGDLRRLDGASLDTALQGVEYVLGEDTREEQDDDLAGGGDGSLFRALLWALLVCIVGDSVLARWLGGSR